MKINLKKRFLEFAHKFCERSLYSYQKPFALRLIQSVFNDIGAEITVLFARQCGKTETLCVTVAFICIFINMFRTVIPKLRERFEDGIWIGIFAPKAEQAQVDLRRIRKFLNNSVLSKFNLLVESDSYSRFEVYRETKKGKDIWFHLEAISASETSNIESKTFHLMIIEEAQDVTERKILDEILPMGAATNATVVLIGTVGNQRWYFYNACKRNEAHSPENAFNVDFRIPIACNFKDGAYKTYVEKQMRKHGYESEFFKKKFRNIWTLELGQLFTFDSFWRVARKDLDWMQSCSSLPDRVFLAAGLDVAKDPDETVLFIGTVDYDNGIWIDEDDDNGYEPLKIVRYMESWGGANFTEQKAEIKKTLERFPLLKKGVIAVDATGDRGAFVEWLEDIGYTVEPVVFSAGVSTGKGELCVKFVDALNAGHLHFAAPESVIGSEDWHGKELDAVVQLIETIDQFRKFKSQAFDCEKEWKGNRLDLHHPAGVGYFDDYIDAWMLFNKAAGAIDYIDYSEIGMTGKIITADLMKDIQQIDWDRF